MAQEQKVLVLDNGAHAIKTGYSTATDPKLIPNCITKAKHDRKRIFIADQLNECKDLSGLYFMLPFEKGYLVKWEVEYQIWDHVFGKESLNVDFEDTCLIFTEPYLNFSSISDAMNEVIFEDYQFASALRTNAGRLAAYKYQREHPETVACQVVDTGFSFSHSVPYVKQELFQKGIVRTNVGGKILTNYLKDVISYRQLQVMEEFHVMNQCKEDVCFVSQNFNEDMKNAKVKRGNTSTFAREYVLPDYCEVSRGFIRDPDLPKRDDEQVLKLNQERFAVPEILFRPSDVGIEEMGIAEATAHSILQKTPEYMRSHLSKNIVLIGGSALFPGFRDRFQQEIRPLLPDVYDVRITCENPMNMPWTGGAELGRDSETLKQWSVTKQEWEEHGPSICAEKFKI